MALERRFRTTESETLFFAMIIYEVLVSGMKFFVVVRAIVFELIEEKQFLEGIFFLCILIQ